MDFENIKKVGIRTGIGIAVSVFLLLVNGLGSLDFLYDFGNYLSEPITFGIGQFSEGVENLLFTIIEIGYLKEENQSVINENLALKAEIGKSVEVELQNEILNTQLNSIPTQNTPLILARILGVDRSGISEHVVVDLGSDDGIEVGNAVVIGDILVGDIRDVYKTTSRVRLVTNRNSNIVSMNRNTRAKGLVRGSLDGLVMEEILESEDVNVDDVIIVWSDNFPRDLVIGTVVSVQNDPTASTKKAYLDPGVSLENLNYVFIVLDE
jgi:rod shape-determining protein MreC